MGREWQSPTGNLYASTLVRLRPGDPDPASLALVAGVALQEAAAGWGGVDLYLKWPNDLMAGSAKLAGILLERAGDAIVVGLGVNLVHRAESLERPTASFPSLGLGAPDAGSFVVDLAEAFARWLQRWRGEGLGVVREAWLHAAHSVGTPLIASGETGLFDGLDHDGALRLRRADGTIAVIHAGDVFLL